MKILVISDIHANLTALNRVLDDSGSVDAVWCLGDLVGYGAEPNECVEQLSLLPNLVCLMGNHDAAVVGQLPLESFNNEAQASIRWTQQNIQPHLLEFLKNQPTLRIMGNITLAHASPRLPIWEYILDTETARINMEGMQTPYAFVGHTHQPVTYSKNGRKWVDWEIPLIGMPMLFPKYGIFNPGSVGQPRDRDPRAAYAIYDDTNQTWEAHRVAYDISTTQKAILTAGLPTRHATRLNEGW